MRVLAFGAHPDDIEIGCGGSLAVHADRGDEVYLFIATEGGAGGDPKVRHKEAEKAAEILGAREILWGGFADTHLPEDALALLRAVEDAVRRVHPEIVYVNHERDTHQDHRALAKAVHSATRYVPTVLAYETPTTIDFAPTAFMEISAALSRKIKALEAHASQIERTGVKLNIVQIALATAHFRGVQSRLSCAEGFVPIRLRL